MRILLITLAIITLTTPAFAGKDTKMSCAEIEAAIAESEAIVDAATNAETTKNVTNAAAGAAVQGGIAAGLGSSIPFIGGLSNVAGAVASGSAEKAKADAEKAEKRIIKLETIADMKDCN